MPQSAREIILGYTHRLNSLLSFLEVTIAQLKACYQSPNILLVFQPLLGEFTHSFKPLPPERKAAMVILFLRSPFVKQNMRYMKASSVVKWAAKFS